MSNRIVGLAAILLFITTACGGSSPTEPNPTGGTTAGASISGTLQSGGSSSLTSAVTSSAIAGTTVTVVGTSITSVVDASGRFTLRGVPAGTVQLQFSGPVSATVTVNEVRTGESISLVLSVTSSSVTVESEARTGAGEEELEGRVESLPPTMPAGSLKVAGRTVTTNGSTQIRQGSTQRTLADIEIGYRVHVKGQPSGTSLLASSIEIQNVNTAVPVNVNGVIDSLTGSATAFEFKIGSRIIKGDTATEFFGDGSTADSFADLKDGVRVEVKGSQRDGYIYAQRIHINDDDDEDDDDDQDSSASIHGKLTAMSGTKPSLTLTVGGTTVLTTSSTEVKRRGDVQTLDTLKVGMELHVIGERQSDSSIIARRIEINDDETGGEFEIEGSAGGVSGTCPAITFSVNGYSIKTTSTTTFEETTCGAIKSGTKVNVKGIVGADGVVTATRVKLK